MSYVCDLCDYSTTRKYNYDVHMKSKKHLDKNINISLSSKKTKNTESFVCNLCNREYNYNRSYLRHIKDCEKTMLSNINNEYTKLKGINDNLVLEINHLTESKNSQIKKLNSEINDLRNLIEYFKGILGTTTETLDKSVTAYKLAVLRFPNPVLLGPPINYELLIHNEEYPKLKNHKRSKDNDKLVDTLTYEYSKKRLPKYIGDFIVRCYKKEGDDIKNQSMWNSDTSRLNYIIATEINKENMWDIDKKGTKVKNLVIIPTFNKIKPILKEFVDTESSKNINNMKNWTEKRLILDKIKYASEIIKEIDEDTLSNAILKYIAPYFYLNKDGELS